MYNSMPFYQDPHGLQQNFAQPMNQGVMHTEPRPPPVLLNLLQHTAGAQPLHAPIPILPQAPQILLRREAAENNMPIIDARGQILRQNQQLSEASFVAPSDQQHTFSSSQLEHTAKVLPYCSRGALQPLYHHQNSRYHAPPPVQYPGAVAPLDLPPVVVQNQYPNYAPQDPGSRMSVHWHVPQNEPTRDQYLPPGPSVRFGRGHHPYRRPQSTHGAPFARAPDGDSGGVGVGIGGLHAPPTRPPPPQLHAQLQPPFASQNAPQQMQYVHRAQGEFQDAIMHGEPQPFPCYPDREPNVCRAPPSPPHRQKPLQFQQYQQAAEVYRTQQHHSHRPHPHPPHPHPHTNPHTHLPSAPQGPPSGPAPPYMQTDPLLPSHSFPQGNNVDHLDHNLNVAAAAVWDAPAPVPAPAFSNKFLTPSELLIEMEEKGLAPMPGGAGAQRHHRTQGHVFADAIGASPGGVGGGAGDGGGVHGNGKGSGLAVNSMNTNMVEGSSTGSLSAGSGSIGSVNTTNGSADASTDECTVGESASKARRKAMAKRIGFMPTDPDGLSSHEKKRYYLECLENYTRFLTAQLELLPPDKPMDPVPFECVTSYSGLNSRSIRTMLVYMERNCRDLNEETMREEQRYLRLREAFFQKFGVHLGPQT